MVLIEQENTQKEEKHAYKNDLKKSNTPFLHHWEI